MVESDITEPSLWAFVAPFVIFMLVGVMSYPSFELTVDQSNETLVDAAKTRQYCITLVALVILISGILVYFRKQYFAQFPWRFSPLSIVVGVVGVVLWVWICAFGVETAFFEYFGWSKSVARPSFNPYEQISDPGARYAFLFFRFALLAVIVPIVEELFLRGWLIRYIDNPNWWTVAIPSLSFGAIATATAYGVLAHPGEAIAALVWFSLVSWLMVKTGNIWDCVIAHGVTNLLLGLYVIWKGAWHLW